MQHDCQVEESDVSGKQPHQHLIPESQEDLSLSSDSTSAQKNRKMNMSNQFLGCKTKL